jgi:AraC-like DNA-binding protein
LGDQVIKASAHRQNHLIRGQHTRMVYQSAIGVDDVLANHPGRGMVQARYLQGLSDTISHLGGDPRNIFEIHGRNPAAFDNPDRNVDCIRPLRMMEYCSVHLDDPLFGLRLADHQGPDAFGCLAVAAKAAPNVRQALRIFVDYLHIINSPEGVVELVASKNTAELRWRTDFDVSRQSHYHGLLLFMQTLRMIGRDDFRPRYTTLNFKPEANIIDDLEKRIGCRIVGACTANAIAFPLDILDRPVRTSNRMLFTLLVNQLEQLKHATTRLTLSEQVEAYIRDTLSAGDCSVRSCSEKLGTSIRTLQKRLGEKKLKFSDLLEKQRIQMAKLALRSETRALSEIAACLGYADQTSFGRAFNRWTGITPKAFRAQLSKWS